MRLKSKRASLALYVKVRCGLTRKPGFNAISATQLPKEKKRGKRREAVVAVVFEEKPENLSLYCSHLPCGESM